ncbi:MAG: CopD family protein, partial [Ilumatobacter sp.]
EWSAFSALDGHGSAGEFAFSVGVDSGELPASVARSSSDRIDMVGAWSFFVGLSAVVGALLLGSSGSALTYRRSRRIGTFGLITAVSAVSLVLVRGRVDAVVLLWCVQALLAALVMIRFERLRLASLGAVVVAAALWSSRHHAASALGWIGALVDTLHLMSAVAWPGALSVVVVTGWLDGDAGRWWSLVRRHSRLASVLVAVTAATGVVSAWTILPSWGSLTATGYGRLVAGKVLLLVVAVALAFAARFVLLPRRRRFGLLRATSIETIVLAGALVVAALLVTGAPPLEADAAAELLGPEPLTGAVSHDAGLAGQLNVWISTNDERLDVSVSSPSGPVRGTTIELSVVDDDGIEVGLEPRPCGPGCFTTAITWPNERSTLHVSAAAPDWEGGSFAADVVRPPGRLASDILDDVIVRMRAVPMLQLTETVTSGPGSRSAPGTFTLSGDRFIATEPYAAGNVDHVRLLPGQPERLVMYLPGSQIFAELELADDRRIVSSRLVTPGHVILHEFSYDVE